MNKLTNINLKNIQRVHFDKFEKDFSFIVNGQIYKTNSFVANILSPHISKMTDENMNVRYYQVNTKHDGDFNRIIENGEMKSMNIKEEENQYFRNIMKQLGNNDEAIRFYEEFQADISNENVIQRMQIKADLELNFDEEITFISKNFHEFHTKHSEAMLSLDLNTIEQIICNSNLKVQNEEELFDFVLELYLKSKEYATLFSYVIFLNLTTNSIQKFRQYFDINDINNSIWTSICYRLEQNISKKSKISYKESNKQLLTNRYTGIRCENILEYLNQKCHGNAHSKKIVEITSSSRTFGNASFAPSNLAGSWIQFDFKERNVLLDRYTIPSSNNLRNWVLEVSNDGKIFQEIHRHEINPNGFYSPMGTSPLQTFGVSCSTPQKFVRLRVIGPNNTNTNMLDTSKIEFSGFLIE